VIGGKWTTYRKMAEDTLSKIMRLKMLPFKNCITGNLKIHGYETLKTQSDSLSVYGTDKFEIKALMEENESRRHSLSKDFQITEAQVVWAVRKEMALTVEDVLARRTRILFIDAKIALDLAPKVAEIMMKELGHDETWKQDQLKSFYDLAQGYVLKNFLNRSGIELQENDASRSLQN
jgi:glycerol-3-phosphate dehydrogenase